MSFSLLTVITALGWVGALAVVLAYGMVSRGRWTADSLAFQLSNFGGAFVMLLIAIANGIWPSALANVAAVVIGAAAMRTITKARRAERARAVAAALAETPGEPHLFVVDGSDDPTAGRPAAEPRAERPAAEEAERVGLAA